jgi:transposase
MRYELTDHEWKAIRPMLPNKPRGVPRVMQVRDWRCGGCQSEWPAKHEKRPGRNE